MRIEADPNPPVAAVRPHAVTSPHGVQNGSLLLAAGRRAAESAGAGLPSGGKRVSGALHGRGQALRGRAIRGNRRAPEAGRCQRALSQARLLVHSRASNRARNTRYLCAGEVRWMRPKRSSSTPMHLPGSRLLPDRRPGSLAGWRLARILRGYRRQAPVHACASRICAAARFSARRYPKSRRTSHGPTTIGRCCTSRRIPRRCSAFTSRSTCSARIRGAMRWCSSKRTRASTPACPNPNRMRFIFIHMESTVSSEWRYARCRRSAARIQDLPAARARPRIPAGTSGRRLHRQNQLAGAQFPPDAGAHRPRSPTAPRGATWSRTATIPSSRISTCSTASSPFRCAPAASPRSASNPCASAGAAGAGRAHRVLHRQR